MYYIEVERLGVCFSLSSFADNDQLPETLLVGSFDGSARNNGSMDNNYSHAGAYIRMAKSPEFYCGLGLPAGTANNNLLAEWSGCLLTVF